MGYEWRPIVLEEDFLAVFISSVGIVVVTEVFKQDFVVCLLFRQLVSLIFNLVETNEQS